MAGVVGKPSERLGEEVVAFVALHEEGSVDADELVSWARERIGGYKYPREVRIVENVPLTPVGKVDRKALRARVSDAPAGARRARAREAMPGGATPPRL